MRGSPPTPAAGDGRAGAQRGGEVLRDAGIKGGMRDAYAVFDDSGHRRWRQRLACAARLAAKGRKVTLLEAAETVRGRGGEREFAPGSAPALAHLTQGWTRMARRPCLPPGAGDHRPPVGPIRLVVRGGRPPAPMRLWRRCTASFRISPGAAPFRQMRPIRLAGENRFLGWRGMGWASAHWAGRLRNCRGWRQINVHDAAEDELTDDGQRFWPSRHAGAWLGALAELDPLPFDRPARG